MVPGMRKWGGQLIYIKGIFHKWLKKKMFQTAAYLAYVTSLTHATLMPPPL